MLNKELEAFSYSVAHDLRSPLITIDGFAQVLLENLTETLDETNRKHLERITTAVRRMHRLINDLLGLSKIVRGPLTATTWICAFIAREVVHGLHEAPLRRVADFTVAEDMPVRGDHGLLRIVLENLMSNAWKFTARKERAQIEARDGDRSRRHARSTSSAITAPVSIPATPRSCSVLSSACTPSRSSRVPASGWPQSSASFTATVGQIWAESAVDCGATFYFTPGANSARLEAPVDMES